MPLVTNRSWPPLEEATQEQRERNLVDRHRYGDASAFDDLYHRFSSMVYNLSLRLAGDPALAEDLSQEVFIRIYRGLGRFQCQSSLKTWVYRVCLNHCRTRLGRRSRRQRFELPEDPERQVADPSAGPEEDAMSSDARRVLAAALPEIDPVYREAVVLRDLEELSYVEIAAVLEIPVGTVRSRIARGRDQLRSYLEARR
jgi:RNA polymerase sigma-70 factor (ECF subfamily)